MDDKITNTQLSNLEEKTIKLSLLNIVLEAQGYVVNQIKKTKLEWGSILIHALENYLLFDHEGRNNIDYMYNKLFNDGRA